MPEESSISRQIDEILTRRKLKAENIKRRKAGLQELKRTLLACGQLPAKAKTIEDPELQKQCLSLLSAVRIPMDVRSLDQLLRRIDEAVDRFDRDSLNIATVGRARQGKSTFLQAVGNLGNDIIPAFDAGDCTGAVSVIHNAPAMESGQVRVELTFRSQDELLEIVKGYIGNISQEYLAENPLEYDSIAMTGS